MTVEQEIEVAKLALEFFKAGILSVQHAEAILNRPVIFINNHIILKREN